MTAKRQNRVVATAMYLASLMAIHWMFIGSGFPLDQNILWLINGVASLILGSRLLNPHFTPPADVATNAFFAAGTMLAALAATPINTMDSLLVWVAFLICCTILVVSLLVLIVRKPQGLEDRTWLIAVERVIKGAGDPRFIFTGVLLLTTWLFHRDRPNETFVILASWTFVVALEPVEAILDFFEWVGRSVSSRPKEVLGQVAAYQNPGLVLIRQFTDARYPPGTLMALSDQQGPVMLGVALNYVGRDDGILLRALSLPIPPAIKSKVTQAATGGSNAAIVEIEPEELREILVLERIGTLCGIVDSESSLDLIEIEITNDSFLSEGRLVDVKIGAETVIYQIIDGTTREDSVQQKNKYGYVRAKARKVGAWDAEAERFTPVSWLPRINAPVFLKASSQLNQRPEAIGHFPETDYQVAIDVSEAVTHNTAILGILGIGKSYLAIELVERMIAQGIKVICLDLTDQYALQLADFYVVDYHNSANASLAEAAKGRPVEAGKESGGSIHAFIQAVREELVQFIGAGTGPSLRIINPANFRVSKQTINAYQGNAAFADLTPSEITAIVSTEALSACQALGMTDSARVCLIYEEAHTLVPEWNSVASDGDRNATAASARSILQGRKFGLGCLLVTQRTANVTKTILNQCNTIFAMRTFDDTGKEFLGNYIGPEYARILPTLKERHAVFFGKASSCDDPVLLRLNDRDRFLDAFRGQTDA